MLHLGDGRGLELILHRNALYSDHLHMLPYVLNAHLHLPRNGRIEQLFQPAYSLLSMVPMRRKAPSF